MRERFGRYHSGVPTNEDCEQAFPSTMWEFRYVKMKRRPQGSTTARAQRGPFKGLSRWPRTSRLTVTIVHRGGSESWWLVSARGTQGAFPGWMALEDVMAVVHNSRR